MQTRKNEQHEKKENPDSEKWRKRERKEESGSANIKKSESVNVL